MRITADDATIDVASDGQGDAILLIHGFPFAKEIWDAQAAQLAKGAHVIRPDLRGFGSSSVPAGPYLMETFAGDVAAVLDAMHVERAAIVGHSMGGYVALAFARMYTERVTRLVLVCSRVQNDTPQIARERENFATRIEGDMEAALFKSPYFKGLFSPRTLENNGKTVDFACELARRNSPAGLAAAMRGMGQRVDASDIAEDLHFPVLVVGGQDDKVVTPAEAEQARAAFPQADLRILPGCGHVPMLEDPQGLSEALEGFLGSGAATGRGL